MIRASDVRLAQAPATAVDEDEILNILSVADLKREVRRMDASEDAKFEDAIKEAYYRLDGPLGWLNRAILEQQWVGVVDRFDDAIELPLPPLVSVDLIRYRDVDGAWQTLSSDAYGFSTFGLMGVVHCKSGASLPAVTKEPGGVEITFTCGYEDGAAVLENMRGIRRALKLLGGHYFHTPLPTFSEPRTLEVPRKVQYALDFVIQQLRIVNDHS
jgi:hypothetical protein